MKVQTIQGLVKGNCACHDNNCNGISNYCCTEETPGYECIYFMKNPDDYFIIRCKYFEECVLPLDKELEAVYYAQIDAEKNKQKLTTKDIEAIKEKNKNTVTCANSKCKKEFKPSSNRQKYCDKCKKENAKVKQKDWVKNKRKNL